MAFDQKDMTKKFLCNLETTNGSIVQMCALMLPYYTRYYTMNKVTISIILGYLTTFVNFLLVHGANGKIAPKLKHVHTRIFLGYQLHLPKQEGQFICFKMMMMIK